MRSFIASFTFLGVSMKFICVDELGVVSKESKTFPEVLRILRGGEFCMHGIISITKGALSGWRQFLAAESPLKL